MYKLISKAIANRLKGVLDIFISPTQSAFVPRRNISDNVVVGFKCLHHIKHKKKGSVGWATLKLDMSKAYDRVEWFFLEKLMLVLGLDGQVVSLIIGCVTSVSYSFMLNGKRMGHIKPSRGLRQGDHLSPYLFLLCAEGLSRILGWMEEDKRISVLKIARDSPSFLIYSL